MRAISKPLSWPGAERLVFGSNGSGVAHDVERVSDLVRRMVCEFAMSEAVGPLDYRGDGTAGGQANRSHSEEVARTIDAEIRRLVDEAGERATRILAERRPALDAVAVALLERESLTGAELAAVADGAGGSPEAVPRASKGSRSRRP